MSTVDAALADALGRLAEADSAYRSGRLLEAEDRLEAAATQAPGVLSPDIDLARARFAIARGQWRLADDLLLRALSAAPDSVDATRALGELCVDRGDLVQATHWLARLAELAPSPEAASQLEAVMLRRRRDEPAGEPHGGYAAPTPAAYAGKRVLAITDLFHPSVGGTEVLTESAAVALQALGMEVEVATRRLGARTELEYRGLAIRELDPASPAQSLESLLRTQRYDALLTFTGPLTDLFAAVASIRGPRPRSVVVPCVNPYTFEQLHADPQRLVRYREALSRLDVVCYSSRTGSDRAVLDEIAVEAHYVPNAVDHHRGTPGFRARHGLPEDVPLLVMVANYWPEKNHHELIDELSRAPGDWHLVMIGGPALDHPWLIEEVRAQAARDPRITLAGSLPPAEVASAFDECSAVLLPSLAEATPLVLLEAMSHRRPWIASPRTGGAHDYSGGLMAPLTQFAEAIEFLLSHGPEADALGAAGHRHWEQCYRWEVVAPQYGELLLGRTVRPLTSPAPSVEVTDRVRGEYYAWRVSRRGHGTSHGTGRGGPAGSVCVGGAGLPTVTCLMAARNHEQFIAAALESVLTQDYPADLLDVVVVDDGSEDRTASVARACAARAAGRVRVVSQEHQGPAVAMNAAMREARGELLAVCDSDDLWLQHKVSTQVRQFGQLAGLSLSYGDLEVIDAGGALVSPSLLKSLDLPELFGDAVDAIARVRFGVSSTLMFRARDVHPVDPGSPYADYALAAQAGAAGRVQPLGRPFARARLHATNLALRAGAGESQRDARRALIAMRRRTFGGDLAARVHPRTLALLTLMNKRDAALIRRSTSRGFEAIAVVSDAERQRSVELLETSPDADADDALRRSALAALADPFNLEAWEEVTRLARARPDLEPAWMP